ncbi:MAG: ABC transporter ATP-binding protein [Chlamydiae bacterium]|nr:ABC transporter ATP-binding protein [Chlamydiota bacterium]
MSFLKVENLRVSFSSSGKRTDILKNLSFQLEESQTLGILGRSGSGKTTAVRALTDLLPSASISGSVFYRGQNLLTLKEKSLQRIRGRHIGYVFQHPASAFLSTRKMGDQMIEVLSYHRIGAKDSLKKIAKDFFSLVGLDPDQTFQKLPSQLSGGEIQRAAIAIALACNPNLLIVDEPTASLDSETKEQITNLLKTLQRELKVSLIVISHDPEVLTCLCKRLIVMHEGIILMQGETKKILSKYFPLAPSVSSPPSLLKKPLLEVKKLSVQLSTFALKDISFSLSSKDTLGLIGKSGSGKSTLAKAILQLLPSASGEVFFEGQKLIQNLPGSLRRNMQLIFQDFSLSPRLSVRQILEEPFKIHQLTPCHLPTLLDSVGLSASLLSCYPHELSGGQRQRVCIARAIALKPKLLICDEPFSALDLFSKTQILNLLRCLQEEFDLSYLLISHDKSLLEEICSQILILEEGHLRTSFKARPTLQIHNQMVTN